MALYVYKFGGSSLATSKHIQHVASNIQKARADGDQVVVVVSAMGGETNRLVSLASGVAPESRGRDFAALVTCGELMSMSLLTLTLQSQGCPAKSFKAGEAGIYTTDEFDCAQITEIHPHAILAALERGEVPVVAGFQGVNADGEITTLGRGGSDATAVALTNALGAQECRLYTDVLGVYSVDPALMPDVACLPFIRADEMLALSEGGARIMQSYALELAICYSVPVRIMPTFATSEGTKLIYQGEPAFQGLRFGLSFRTEDGDSLINHALERFDITQAERFIMMTIVHRELLRSNDFSVKLLNLLKNKGIKIFAQSVSTIALSALIKENDVRLAAALFQSPDVLKSALAVDQMGAETKKIFCETV